MTRTAGTPPASSTRVWVPAGGLGMKRAAASRHSRICGTLAAGRSRRLMNQRTPRRTSSARKLMTSPGNARDGWATSRRSESRGGAVKVVGGGALDAGGDDLAHPQGPPTGNEYAAVDFRRVGAAASLRHGRPDLVDEDRLTRADLSPQAPGRD